jgi:hypothetical protein
MKVKVLYRDNTDHTRSVLTFQDEFERRTSEKVELVSLDTVEGSETARIYDITSYPAVLVTTDTGELQQLWQGEQLPLINDVRGYLH